MRQLAAIAGAKRKHFSVSTQVPVFQRTHMVNVVLQCARREANDRYTMRYWIDGKCYIACSDILYLKPSSEIANGVSRHLRLKPVVEGLVECMDVLCKLSPLRRRLLCYNNAPLSQRLRIRSCKCTISLKAGGCNNKSVQKYGSASWCRALRT